MTFPEFMTRKEIVLELTIDQLKNYVKLNIFKDADVEVKDGKVLLVIPLDLFIPYDIQGDKIVLKLPAKA